jgi:GT2 family glycosyltransferase
MLVESLMSMKTSLLFEITVVEETDHPSPIPKVRYISHPVANRGFPFARNLAIKNTDGRIVVFLDDDCRIENGWLDHLLSPFADDAVLGVQGGVTVPPQTNAIGWAESILGFPGGGIRRILMANGEIQETREISTLNCAYRRAVLEKIGGFAEFLIYGSEDYFLAKQVCSHGKCFFAPRALVYHDARGNFSNIWRWFVRRGRAEMALIKSQKLRELNAIHVVKGSVFLKIIVFLFIAHLFPAYLPFLFFGAAFAYSCIQGPRYYGTWKGSKAPVSTLILLPLVKLTMDMAMDWGRLRGLLAR